MISPIPSISVTEHLEQGAYQHQQLVEGMPAGPIHFNAGLGVCYGGLDALANGGDSAFSLGASIGVKASIRFEVRLQRAISPAGDSDDQRRRQLLQFPRRPIRQVRMRGRNGWPITLREMGERVFEELKKLMVNEVLFSHLSFPFTFTCINRTTPKTEGTSYDTAGP